MTSRNDSRNDMIPNSQSNKPSPSPRDIDNTFRRLARVPNKKLNANRNVNETPDNFASNFFAQNPDTPLDKRSPQEKLDEINAKLHDLDLEENDRFSLLVQKKAICSLVFGDSSPQSFEALYQLGCFYNSQQRPDSALRHLLKAQEIIKTLKNTDEDQKYSIAIEISDAYLSIRPKNDSEKNRNLVNAENVLRPYDQSESEDKTLEYRKLLIQARIKFLRKQYDDSYNLYRKAYEVLDSANQGKITEQVATLFHEMAECAEKGDDPKTALDMYQRAYDTFCELGMNESAKLLKPKISKMTKFQAKLNDLEEEEDYNQYSRVSSSRSNSRAKSKI